MKKSFLLVFATLSVITLFGQNSSQLVGVWEMNYKGSEKEFILRKQEKNDQNLRTWGHFIEFHEDGTYNEKASAPCGMDDNRFSYSGKWIYTEETKKIELTEIVVCNGRPNIYNDYTVLSNGTMQVLSFEKKSFHVKITKLWEKVTAKK